MMKIRGLILDLDGTVYYGKKPVKGAVNFIRLMQKNGIKCLFVTNRANRTPFKIRNQLVSMGIPCKASEILTASQATAQYLPKGKVYFIGEWGLERELLREGHTITDENPDYVVVSFDRRFNFAKLYKACNLIIRGAKFVATNTDKSLVMDDTISPGTGSLAASIETACGIKPLVVGKPQKRIMNMALKKLELQAKEVVAIGDNITTDVLAGHAAGMRTALLLTGVSKRNDVSKSRIKPTWVVENYKELIPILLNAK